MAVKYELDLRDYLRIIRRHKWRILSIMATVTIVSLFFTIITKPQPRYQSTSSVAIDKKAKQSGIFGGLSRPDYSVLESESELMKSFPVVVAAAKQSGILNTDLSFDEIQQNKDMLATVLDFQNLIFVSQQGDTNIIDITVEYTDPRIARDAANAIALIYKKQNFAKNVKQAKNTREFIQNRFKIAQKKLVESENILKKFQETNNVVALDSQMDQVLDDETDLKDKITDIDNKLDQMELMLDRFSKDIKNSDEIIVDIRPGIFSGHFDGLIAQLVDTITKKSTLLNIYTEANPHVLKIQETINITVNNITGHLESGMVILKNEKKGLQERLKETQAKVRIIPENNLAFGRLERRVLANNEIMALLDQRYQEALIREADQGEEVRIVRPALLPQSPINPPKIVLKTVLGFALGSILGLIFAFVFENFDTSFDTIDDLESIVKLPVIGVIPFIETKELIANAKASEGISLQITENDPLSRLIMHYFPKKPVAESFRSLRTNVVFETSQKKAKVICITSSMPSEGKSTIAANLALSLAQAGKHTLLVDVDLRKGSQNQIFGVEKSPGLTELILESSEPTSTIRDITDIIIGSIGMELIARTPGWDNFDFIPTGTAIRGNETEILSSNTLKSFIKKWKEEYDYVILDLPPILVASDALILTPIVDEVLMVYKVGQVARGSLIRAKSQLDGVKGKILGIVINGIKEEAAADFGQYQYYSDYYRDEKVEKKSGKTLLENVKSFFSILKTPHLLIKSPTFIMTTGIISIIITGLLFGVGSWQEVRLKFSGVDFLLTGLFFIFMGLAYIGVDRLLVKFNIAIRFPLFSILKEKIETLLEIFKKKKVPPAKKKEEGLVEEVNEPSHEEGVVEEASKPSDIEEETDAAIDELESFTKDEKEEITTEDEVSEPDDIEEKIDAAIDELESFTKDEKEETTTEDEVSEPADIEEKTDDKIEEPESFTKDEKEEATTEDEVSEPADIEEKTEDKIEEPESFTREEIDKKLDEAQDQTEKDEDKADEDKKDKDKKDEDEPDTDDWDKFLGT